MITIKTALRKNRRDDQGLAPVCFRINDNGNRFQVATGIKLAPEHFSDQKEEVLRGAPDFLYLGTLLARTKERAKAHLYQCELAGLPVDPDDFRATVMGKESPKEKGAGAQACFYNLLSAYIENTTLHYSVYLLYTRTAERLKKLYPVLPIDKVGYDVVTSFRTYVEKTFKVHPNTSNKAVQVLKTIVHYAQKKGLKTDTTIGFVKCPTIDTTREHLSMEELEFLMEKYMGTGFPCKMHKVSVGAFLLTCYTGLRYSDLHTQIKTKGATEILRTNYVMMAMQKTGKVVSVPLTHPAKELINAGAMERIYTNQKSNEYLHVALKSVGIHRDITFHCGRHTFAVNSLRLGIPIEVLQQLLGHTKIQTTMIYAKVVDVVKESHMEKWNITRSQSYITASPSKAVTAS